MPVEVFRAREADLLRYEALVPVLEKTIRTEREKTDKLVDQVYSLTVALDSERKAAQALVTSLKVEIRQVGFKSGIVGFLAGGIAGYAAGR